MVSGFNIGEGIPVTINRRGLEGMPGFPLRDSAKVHVRETEAMIGEVRGMLDEFSKEVEAALADAKLSQPKRWAITEAATALRRKITDSLPFMRDLFMEQMETRVERAKTEVHAYMAQAIRSAGLEALQRGGSINPIELEDNREGGQ